MRATEVGAAAQPPAVAVAPAHERPHAASWLNRLLWWIEGLPGPAWVAYAAIALAGIAGGHLAIWETGLLPWGQLDAAQTFWGVYLPAQVWVIGHLDRVAGQALDAFRPAVDLSDDEAAAVEYELTVVPAGPALAIGLLALPLTLLFYAADPVGAGIIGYDAFALAIRTAAETFVGAVLLVFVYRTVRQLRLVSRLHAAATHLDLFQPRPLHAFSRLTSRTAVALLLLISTGLLANPVSLESSAFWALWAPWLIGVPLIAGIVFVLPLYGMHRRLLLARDGLLAASDARIRSLMMDLALATDARDVPRVDGLQKILASQLVQRDVLARLTTWPWSFGTLRGFVSALLLPIVLFLVQRFLADVLVR